MKMKKSLFIALAGFSLLAGSLVASPAEARPRSCWHSDCCCPIHGCY
jgi:hypothetical protein